jgi:predicted porin
MIGGLLKSTSRLALVAAAGVIAGGIGAAQAADLGGDCCADLEERVAELEATTARKGNRKVSLTVYGQVSEEVMFWDDGGEQNAYVVENGDNKNRFGFRGGATIDSDWSASFQIEYQIKAQSSDDVTQLAGGDDPNSATATLSQRLAFFALTSKTFGQIAVGQQNTASSGITTINLANSAAGSGDGDFSNWGSGMFLRRSGTTGDKGLQSSDAFAGGDSVTWATIANNWGSAWTSTSLSRRNVVKYTTPTFGGFALSTSWGEDDTWDAALRYAGEFSGFRLAAGIGYAQVNDETSKCANLPGSTSSGRDCHSLGGSASIMHVPTGLYVSGGASQNTDNNRVALFVDEGGASFANIDDTDTLWWIQVGIEQKFNALGKTTIYGQYWQGDLGGIVRSASSGDVVTLDPGDPLNPFAASDFIVTRADTTAWGVGIVQSIDAAAMDLYIHYQNNSTELFGRIAGGGATADTAARTVEDLQIIGVGATIKF